MLQASLRNLPCPPLDRPGWPWTVEPPPLPAVLPDGRPWPKFSIVMPSFNQGRFIEEAIRSVLLQGYPDLEFIVMDGGSTDATISILKKYDPWLTRWVSEKDRGQSHAINEGMAQATGEILAYLNSDDIYLPSAFASVAEALAGRSGWCISDVPAIDEASHEIQHYVSHVPRDWVHQISRIQITTPQPATFWTRDLWKQFGPFDEEMFFSFDFDLFCKFLRGGHRPVRRPSALAAMRRHGETKTALHKDRMHRDDAVIWNRGLAASGPLTRLRAGLVRRWALSSARQWCKDADDSLRKCIRRRRGRTGR